MPKGYKSRQRWLVERWAAEHRDLLRERWDGLRARLLPAEWPVRCQRIAGIPDREARAWLPRPGSSSAELLLLLRPLPAVQRRWLAALLDAPTAGPATLVDALERLQLDWRSRMDPVHRRREYAPQLATLARVLSLPVAAESAYLENEARLFERLDELLFESLPMRLRTAMLSHQRPGTGTYLRWWHERLLARAGEPGYSLDGIGEADWPDIPAGWLAIAWLCGLRRVATKAGESA